MAFRSLLCKKLGYSIVRNWSADRNPTNVNCKNFNFHPILETKEWKNAYSWLKSSLSKTLVRAEQEGDYQLYYTKSTTAGDFTLNKSFKFRNLE